MNSSIEQSESILGLVCEAAAGNELWRDVLFAMKDIGRRPISPIRTTGAYGPTPAECAGLIAAPGQMPIPDQDAR